MRRFVTLAGLAVLVVAVAGLFAGSAAAAGNKKLVEGTVYDTTCATACTPECPPPPHCGPITESAKANVVCAQSQRLIACPLAAVIHGPGPDYLHPAASPAASTTPSTQVKGRPSTCASAVRRPCCDAAGVEGHFEVRLGPGEYVLHPHLPEEPCLVGIPETVKITARTQGPLPVSLERRQHLRRPPGRREARPS